MLPYYFQDEINFLEGEGMLNHHKSEKVSPNKMDRYSKLPFAALDPETADFGNTTNSGINYKCINQRIEVHFSVLE